MHLEWFRRVYILERHTYTFTQQENGWDFGSTCFQLQQITFAHFLETIQRRHPVWSPFRRQFNHFYNLRHMPVTCCVYPHNNSYLVPFESRDGARFHPFPCWGPSTRDCEADPQASAYGKSRIAIFCTTSVVTCCFREIVRQIGRICTCCCFSAEFSRRLLLVWH